VHLTYYIQNATEFKLVILKAVPLDKATLHNGNHTIPAGQIYYGKSLGKNVRFTNIFKIDILTAFRLVLTAFHKISYFFFGYVESIQLFFYDITSYSFSFQYIDEMVLLFIYGEAIDLYIFVVINCSSFFKNALLSSIIHTIFLLIS
jgi:hypothetical protein